MTRLLISSLLILLVSCSSKEIKEDFPFIDRILRPRGDKILTWQKCVEKNWLGDCLAFEVESYDITQDPIRERFSDLGFVCKINKERFHICEHEEKAGFCQVEFKRRWFSKKRIVRQFIGHNEIEKIKDGGTKCFSVRVYDFLQI